MTCAFYDTKPCDRAFFVGTAADDPVTWRFHEFRLNVDTAPTTQGADAVCIFVNDRLDRPCLEILAAKGVRMVALRCAGINNIDLDVYEEEEGVFFEDRSGEVLQDDELSLLITFPNVLITAHQAFLTHEALSEIARVTVHNLAQFRAGLPFLPDTEA